MPGSVWVHAADLWQHLHACCLHRLEAASLREAAETDFNVQDRAGSHDGGDGDRTEAIQSGWNQPDECVLYVGADA